MTFNRDIYVSAVRFREPTKNVKDNQRGGDTALITLHMKKI